MKILNKTLKRIKPIDNKIRQSVRKRLDSLAIPCRSLGRLEEFAEAIAGIKGVKNPTLRNKYIFTMAGDHGVAEEGVSAFPQEVTEQMVHNFIRGKASINVLARHVGAKVIVIDMGVKTDMRLGKGLVIKKVGYGTRNIANGSAMDPDEAIKSLENGIEVLEEELKLHQIDIAGAGDMGIANTTPSSAIIAAITGEEVKKVTGRGTGINEAKLIHKIKVIERALEVNSPDTEDPIDVLSKVGGYEIGGIAGLVLGCAAHRIPVVIDGLISAAGALIAYELDNTVGGYLFASHRSKEIGQKVALDRMGLVPMLDLDMRLGEGTGAVLAMDLLEASVKILNEVASFDEANVTEGRVV